MRGDRDALTDVITDNAKPVVARRGDILVGPERRRKWPLKEKLAIVAESFEPGAIASHVAQRHGIKPQQLFDWRRRVREHVPGTSVRSSGTQAPAFAPVVVDVPAMLPRPSPPGPAPVTAIGSIEIAIGPAVIRIVGPVDPKALAAVMRAVKAVSS